MIFLGRTLKAALGRIKQEGKTSPNVNAIPSSGAVVEIRGKCQRVWAFSLSAS